jgi:putative sigma-54 modulation protein
MNLAITFRQMDAMDSLRNYATEKVGRLQKFLKQPMHGQVTMSAQQRVHTIEVELHAGSHRYHAHEDSDDMYKSIDRVCDKLERQISSDKDSKKGAERASQRLLPATDDE